MTLRYEIPAFRLSDLEATLTRLARRAARFNLTPPTWVVVGEIAKRAAISPEEREARAVLGLPPLMTRYLQVDVAAEVLALPGGWRLAAVLQHEATGTVIRSLPGETIPASYSIRPAWCDHCRVLRRRSDTYVVTNAAGEAQQVGSTCIHDFLGVDPHAVAASFEIIREIEALGEDDGFSGSGGHSAPGVAPLEALATAHAVANVIPWISAAKAREGAGLATADVVWGILVLDRYGRDFLAEHPDFRVTDADHDVSKAVLAWAQEGGDSEYRRNLQVLAGKPALEGRDFRLFASAVPSWLREQAEARRRQQAVALSDFIGAVGKRIEVDATLIDVRPLASRFGDCFLARFTTVDGREAVWFASYDPRFRGLHQGELLTIRGTVKRHDVRGGVKQTVLTRVMGGLPQA
ncbi:hypothetical protein EPN42_10910 [bacterium]|nr:MAG: hypothetical protein EPN42_10910 [bacterium]